MLWPHLESGRVVGDKIQMLVRTSRLLLLATATRAYRVVLTTNNLPQTAKLALMPGELHWAAYEAIERTVQEVDAQKQYEDAAAVVQSWADFKPKGDATQRAKQRTSSVLKDELWASMSAMEKGDGHFDAAAEAGEAARAKQSGQATGGAPVARPNDVLSKAAKAAQSWATYRPKNDAKQRAAHRVKSKSRDEFWAAYNAMERAVGRGDAEEEATAPAVQEATAPAVQEATAPAVQEQQQCPAEVRGVVEKVSRFDMVAEKAARAAARRGSTTSVGRSMERAPKKAVPQITGPKKRAKSIGLASQRHQESTVVPTGVGESYQFKAA